MLQKQKLGNKVKRNKKKIWISLALLAFVLAAILLIWPLVRNDSFYFTDKNKAMATLKSTIGNIQLPGASIYSNVSDIGCDSRNSVGLESFIHCELVGDSYYKTRGNVKDELAILNKKLKQQGWSASFYSNDGNFWQEIAVSNGEQSGSRPYKSADKQSNLIFYFDAFGESKSVEDYWVQGLIDSKKITQPTSGESVYGVYITKTYWTCRSDSLFKLPCPPPPSKPE
jgi:hypothetical protein